MKISRKSWHFRFLNYVNPSKAMDISFDVRHGKYYSECRYFWLILWNLVSRGIMTICCVGFLLGILMGMVLGPYHLISSILNGTDIQLSGIEGLGIGMWILIVWAILYSLLLTIITALLKLFLKKPSPKIETDGMIKSFIKSKKEKVCKKIEFVD